MTTWKEIDRDERLYRVKRVLRMPIKQRQDYIEKLPLIERCTIEIDIRDYQNYKKVF